MFCGAVSSETTCFAFSNLANLFSGSVAPDHRPTASDLVPSMVIDATGTVDEINETIWERVAARIRLDASVGPPVTGPALPLWAASDEGDD